MKQLPTLYEIFGLAASVDIDGITVTRGMTVRVKQTGLEGKVRDIGRYGLVAIEGSWRVYYPEELEVLEQKH